MSDFSAQSIAATATNTGLVGRPLIIKKAVQLIFEPKTTSYTEAQMADPQTTFEGAFLANTPATRSYMLPAQIVEVTDESGTKKSVTWNDDSSKDLYFGKPKYMFVIDSLDHRCLERMQQFNHREADYNVRIVDYDGVVHSTVDPTDSTKTVGFSVSNLFADTIKFHGGDPGDVPKLGIAITFSDARQFNNGNMRSSRTGLDFNGLPRMNTVTLAEVTAPDASRITDIEVMCDNVNLLDTTYETAVLQTGVWKGLKVSDGAALTTSTVTKQTVGGRSVARVTYAATNYPTSGNTLSTNWHLPSVLSGLATPLEGFEASGAITQTAA